MVIDVSTFFSCCITAFLNEAGFNFVRRCIDLVEMRGEAFKSVCFNVKLLEYSMAVILNNNALYSLVDRTRQCIGISLN